MLKGKEVKNKLLIFRNGLIRFIGIVKMFLLGEVMWLCKNIFNKNLCD